MQRDIILMLHNEEIVFRYKNDTIPNVGDCIIIFNKKIFEVSRRVFAYDSNSIVLIGNIN